MEIYKILKEVNLLDDKFFKKINFMIVCSSSSIESKRFAANIFDKNLFYKLKNSEDNLSELCVQHKIQLKIIRPTLIYGNYGLFKDKNFNKIKIFLNIFPVIIFPKNSGLRQPIHCSELAELFFYLLNNLNNLKYSQERISVGGDITLSYIDMINQISTTIPNKLFFRKCRFIFIPNRLFYFFS